MKNRIMRKSCYYIISISVIITSLAGCRKQEGKDYPIRAVHFANVEVTDEFWNHKIERNLEITIPYVLEQLDDKGRIGGSSLYKVLEGISYYLMTVDDPQLEKLTDSLVQMVKDSQHPDGNLGPVRTNPDGSPLPDSLRWLGTDDFGETGGTHGLYGPGHMYEAAVAHYQATGKTDMLDVAEKNAELLLSVFGPDKLITYPFHPEVEMALVKLYRATGNEDYLNLSKFFIDSRGPNGTEYSQSHMKVADQTGPIGHAVRALYLYSGVTDIVALKGDKNYEAAIDRIWNSMVSSKLYITGGTGAYADHEAFGEPYYLPNITAYNETCASIANILWNERMFRLKGNAAYIDVLERILYNSLLDGVSMSGDRFFYPNPLASTGQYQRASYYGVPCCLTNIVRFMPQVPGLIYAHKDNDIYVNLFIGSNSRIELDDGPVQISQETGYPWDGMVIIKVNPIGNDNFTLRIRIPGWTLGQPVPSALYYFMDDPGGSANIRINGRPLNYIMEENYAVIEREWTPGDEVVLELPMQIRKIAANDRVEDDSGRFVIQRGPIVYCLEGPDNKDGLVQNILIMPEAELAMEERDDLMEGTYVINTTGHSFKEQSGSEETLISEQEITAIPYYLWANRGPAEMTVWIPYTKEAVSPVPVPENTIASRSRVLSSYDTTTLAGVNDQFVIPYNQNIPISNYYRWRMDDTIQWVQYVFDKPETVSSVRVYWYDNEPSRMTTWYDDNPWTCCRVPESWELFFLDGTGQSQPVKALNDYGREKYQFNELRFEPVTTSSLRMYVKRHERCASGLQEWEVY